MTSSEPEGVGRHALAKNAVERLTPRELQVLKGIVQGDSSKGIARCLEISPRTVEIHRANLMRKLGAGSSADAVRIGIYAGVDSD